MERDLKLKEFAGELFSYIYREYNSTFDLPVKLPHVFNHHAAEHFSEDEGKAVLKLCMALRSVFSGAFTKAFPQIQKSVKHFMTFLTSRCLKLCGDDLFLSFLMICAFIAELNLFCWINGCFAFMNTAPKCLIAIFNRKLNKEFYASGGWDKLKLFCESFVQTNGVDSGEFSNDDFINQDLLTSIEELLDQNSSSEEDSSLESEESSPDEMEDESNAEESEGAVAVSQEKVDDEEEDEEEDSDEESSMDSDESDSESEESNVEMPSNLNHETVDGDSDDESESSEDDPSSMSDDEESESEDSESDTAPDAEQINCIKPVMQENLSIEKKIL
ncbi:unnamed protein product [Larinioides sclopetarius]|uniref:Uncharacterized protein n=1 Tax=Larinioides sclopetarius TaxID=280406 RepID=A0AAV2BIV3_9ARAC